MQNIIYIIKKNTLIIIINIKTITFFIIKKKCINKTNKNLFSLIIQVIIIRKPPNQTEKILYKILNKINKNKIFQFNKINNNYNKIYNHNINILGVKVKIFYKFRL